MNAVFGVLSILWGFAIFIFFFFKLKEKDFKEFKDRNKHGDGGFPLLVMLNWILRKLPLELIRGIVLTAGAVFIIMGATII